MFFGSVPLLGMKQLWKVSARREWSISFGLHCRIGVGQQNDIEIWLADADAKML